MELVNSVLTQFFQILNKKREHALGSGLIFSCLKEDLGMPIFPLRGKQLLVFSSLPGCIVPLARYPQSILEGAANPNGPAAFPGPWQPLNPQEPISSWSPERAGEGGMVIGLLVAFSGISRGLTGKRISWRGKPELPLSHF